MLNCAAFGCNNTAVEGSGLNFNHFLKDSNMRDWIYYCIRMDMEMGTACDQYAFQTNAMIKILRTLELEFS